MDVQPVTSLEKLLLLFQKYILENLSNWVAKSKATQSHQLLWKAGTVVEVLHSAVKSHWAVKDAP